MKKIMIQKITQTNWNFWTVNLIMRAKNCYPVVRFSGTPYRLIPSQKKHCASVFSCTQRTLWARTRLSVVSHLDTSDVEKRLREKSDAIALKHNNEYTFNSLLVL